MKTVILDQNSHKFNKEIPFHSKVYIMSIIFDSFLFFNIGSQNTTGVNLTVGKLLQFLVLLIFAIKILMKKGNLKIFNFRHPYFRYFIYFIFLSILSGIIGFVSGSYKLENKYVVGYADSILALVIRSSSFRPIMEYFIIIYFFIYYIILPSYMINKPNILLYFFNNFKKAYIICMGLGFLDLFLQLGGIYILPRDIWEGSIVGFRFHGLAGEPRDAFVYIFFGLAVLNLREYWLKKTLLNTKWFIVAILAALLTQSASGFLGIVFGSLIYFLNMLRTFNLKNYFISLSVIILSFVIIYFGIYSSQRLQDYQIAFSNIYEILASGGEIPLLIIPQMVNVFPIWDLYSNLIHGNPIPILLGSGYGSASVVNNNLGKGIWDELSNPHSQLIRLFYECGLIGLFFFVKSILFPVKFMTKDMPKNLKSFFLGISILILGVNLGHRSTSIFMFLGIFIATFNIINIFNNNAKKQNSGFI